MAALKVYTCHPYTVYDERVSNILTLPRQQLRYAVFVVARSKAAAVEFCKQARCGDPRESELRLASGGALGDALSEASLLNEEGVILVTADRGGEKPVVLMGVEEGTQAIGIVRPLGLGSHYVFEACRAAYAGIGSVAVGKWNAYIKAAVTADRSYWECNTGQTLSDEEMQRLIDLNEAEIIRSGFGKWA